MRTATYEEALVTFRNLLNDGVDDLLASEYIRGGVNLIADLFGVFEVDTGTRMEQVAADLRRIPMFADPHKLEQYGVEPYDPGRPLGWRI